MNTDKNPSSVSLAIKETMFSMKDGMQLVEKKVPSEFKIKIANTLEERQSVFHLGYQVYLEKGFIKKNRREWLIQDYDFDPETVILMVEDQSKNLVGSVTLVFDGNYHLPAEKIYGEEIQLLKSSGERLVELSRLVIKPEFRSAKEVLVLLFNYLAIFSYHIKKYSSLVVEVNPRHKNYYKALLNFDEIGSEKPCPGVQNAPAILLHLPLIRYQFEVKRCAGKQLASKKVRSLYPYFLKPEQESLVAYYLEKQVRQMSIDEKIHFGFSNSGIHEAIC